MQFLGFVFILIGAVALAVMYPIMWFVYAILIGFALIDD